MQLYRQTLVHVNNVDVYDYLYQLKSKLQIDQTTCIYMYVNSNVQKKTSQIKIYLCQCMKRLLAIECVHFTCTFQSKVTQFSIEKYFK